MNKVEGFLKAEIEISQERKNGNGMYDGVHVGIAQANQLLDRHIWFCNHVLKLMEEEKLYGEEQSSCNISLPPVR